MNGEAATVPVIKYTSRRLSHTNATHDSPDDVVAASGGVYFSARNSSGSRRMYRYSADSTSLQLISEVEDPNQSLVKNGSIFFTGLSSSSCSKLMKFNPSDASLTQISDIIPSG